MIPVDPKPFKKIHTTLIWAVFVAVMCLLAYACAFYMVNDARANVQSLTSQTATLEREQSEASQIKQQLTDTDAKRLTLVSYFVDVHNPIPFEETIEGYGKNTNTQVLFEGLEVQQSPNRLDASFTVNGSFADIYKFLALLETAPYESSINSLSVQLSSPFNMPGSTNAVTGKPEWQARVTMSVYSVSGVQ